MSRFEDVKRQLRHDPKRWLVTGAAGFIGSNLVEQLLELGQRVIGLDDFSTGHQLNVDQASEGAADPSLLEFIEGDVADLDTCLSACSDVDYVLHQAALGSVPRSLDDPQATHRANVDGMINMLVASRDAGVERFVFAASSSTYGDEPELPKIESRVGRPLSPYAASKLIGELYASVFQLSYDLPAISLRYFNVFGRRQDPEGPYAAVIPAWVARLLAGRPCEIYGDGETSRDFCYIDNVIQANLLAARAPLEATDEVYNVACGARTTLNELFAMIRDGLAGIRPEIASATPVYREFRQGDVRHSWADISHIRERLGYEPTHMVGEGLAAALAWYVARLGPSAA